MKAKQKEDSQTAAIVILASPPAIP